MIMKVYISGKITGSAYPEVHEKFGKAVLLLLSYAVEVVSPLDNGLESAASWESHMLRDIGMLFSCDAVYMLSDWESSVGACIEHDIALRLGKLLLYEGRSLKEIEH